MLWRLLHPAVLSFACAAPGTALYVKQMRNAEMCAIGAAIHSDVAHKKACHQELKQLLAVLEAETIRLARDVQQLLSTPSRRCHDLMLRDAAPRCRCRMAPPLCMMLQFMSPGVCVAVLRLPGAPPSSTQWKHRRVPLVGSETRGRSATGHCGRPLRWHTPCLKAAALMVCPTADASTACMRLASASA